MMVRDYLRWWGQQLISLLPAALQGRGAAAARLPLVELLSPLAHAPAVIAVNQPRRATQIFTLDENGLLRLRGLLGTRRPKLRLRLPTGILLQRDVVLPIAAECAPADVVRLELDRLTPFHPDETFWGCQVTRRDPAQGRLHLRLTLVERAVLAPLLTTLREAGFVPRLLEARRTARPTDPAPPEGDRTEGGRTGEDRTDENWRQIDLGDGGEAATPRPARRAALALCAGLAVAVVAIPFVRQSWALGQAETSIAAITAAVSEASELRRQLGTATAGSDLMADQSRRVGDLLEALAAVTTALPDDTWLTGLTLQQRRLTLAGHSVGAVRLIGRLSAEPALRGAAFTAPVTRNEDKSGGYLFSISAELAP